MKAVRVTGQTDGSFRIAPLPLPVLHRKGVIGPERYRIEACGEAPKSDYTTQPADFLRTILLSDGRFARLAAQPGSLLNFVISGDLALTAGTETCQLSVGDRFLVDAKSAAALAIESRHQGRLVQIGVPDDWPGPDAQMQQPGTLNPRKGTRPNIKRIYTGADDKAYFADFSDLFPATPGVWSAPRRLEGFRMIYWEDGALDYHPGVVKQMAIVASGELQLDVRGGGGASEIFHAGDLCLAEDKTGEGHRITIRGGYHTTSVVFA